MPLAYGLLPRQEDYTNLLEELDTFGPFYPDTVLCDYEAGLRNAVTTVWPGTTLRGCYFHYKQALWRNFARFDLVPEYQVIGSDIRKAFKRIGALPFIPPEDVDFAWQTLRPTIPADMDSFTRYFESTWMGTPNRPALFDPLSWNQRNGYATTPSWSPSCRLTTIRNTKSSTTSLLFLLLCNFVWFHLMIL